MSQNGLDKSQINMKLNQNSLEKIISLWSEKFSEIFAAKYDYHSLNFTADTSVMKNGSFMDFIEA